MGVFRQIQVSAGAVFVAKLRGQQRLRAEGAWTQQQHLAKVASTQVFRFRV
jgi:hypothetical protein